MTPPSIRIRLTAWFVGVLAIATLTLTVASWWLSTQSVTRAADIGLQARVEGVQRFLENPRTRLTVEGLQDEFSEYAELTQDEALLEVIDPSGVVLCQPARPGWSTVTAGARPTGPDGLEPQNARIGSSPFRVASVRIPAAGRVYRVTVAAPMGPAYAALNRFHRWLVLLLPAVLVLAGVGGYSVSRRALAPVDRMTRAVQDVTVQSLDRRLDVPAADDELRRLALTFNDMLARLHTAVRDIVRFTADASHELRTPVALIRTSAELALRHDRRPVDYQNALSEVLAHATHMSALVDDLLVLVRTDTGVETRGDTAIDLRDVASEAGREVATLARSRRVDVSINLPTNPVFIRGDAASLKRLLRILLDNAVKYSPPGGPVRMRVTATSSGVPQPSEALVEVTDCGIGLDPAETGRLFDRFYRGARARAHAPDGSGLGLAIARTIVEGYDGTISLEPAGGSPGSPGCVVRMALPLDGTSPECDGRRRPARVVSS